MWFSRYVIAAMLVDESKRFLISSFCSSTSNCTLQHLSVSLEIGCKPPIWGSFARAQAKSLRRRQTTGKIGTGSDICHREGFPLAMMSDPLLISPDRHLQMPAPRQAEKENRSTFLNTRKSDSSDIQTLRSES